MEPTTTDRLSSRQRRRVMAKLAFVLGGTLSFFLSVYLWFLTEDQLTAIYVGLWVPSLFSLGALVSGPEGDR
jgi:hypothetical protein